MKENSTITMMVIALGLGSFFSRQPDLSRKEVLVPVQQKVIEWTPEFFNNADTKGLTREGNPRTIETPHGKALSFDGVQDGIFLDTNPIENLAQFTIEVLFQPDPKAPPEQRFFHIGEVGGSRLLLETRVTDDDQWCLDAFIKSGDSSRTLIDKTLLHPTGRWAHVAFVVDHGTMDTYVDGQHELNGNVSFVPFKEGKTSIGVRMNRVSWFKGSISKIRITPTCLHPADFMKQ